MHTATQAYHPPEYERSSPESPPLASGAADVWAASMVLVMVFAGRDPESLAKPQGHRYWRWVAAPQDDVDDSPQWSPTPADKRPNPWDNFGPIMRGVTLGVLHEADPSTRPSATDIVTRIGDGSELATEIALFRRAWMGRDTHGDDDLDEDDTTALLSDGASSASGTPDTQESSGFLAQTYNALCTSIQSVANRTEGCVIS